MTLKGVLLVLQNVGPLKFNWEDAIANVTPPRPDGIFQVGGSNPKTYLGTCLSLFCGYPFWLA